MEDGLSEDSEWTINFVEVFENYANVRKWNDSDVLGFIFGNTLSRHVVSVLFNSPVDLNSATEFAVFAESSYSADVAFIGILILRDVEYNFCIEELSAAAKEPENFLRLYADNQILRSREIEEFIDACYPLPLRVSNAEPCLGFTACVTMQLNLHIKLAEPNKFVENLYSAIDLAAQNLDSMCFLNTNQQLLLGMPNSNDNPADLYEGKPNFFYESIVHFTPIRPVNMGAEENGESRLVPVVRVSKGLDKYVNFRGCIKAFTIVSTGDSGHELVRKLRISLSRALFLSGRCIGEYSNAAKQAFVDVDSYAFRIGSTLISAYYPLLKDESILRSCRSKLHRMFNLAFDRPRLRTSQSLTFSPNVGLLRNPHEKLVGYKALGDISLVRGYYDYHHYLQDGYDDCGWGCAYRSLQTIWSWFVHQGYTGKHVPTHKEIQQSLVDCGDKDPKFVGSRQWIGSTELGFCLENMLGIESRIITTNSGSEVADNVRQLAVHFRSVGTPVMIGGGMLAHTILGVDFNEATGQCAFLVLDPHYTGEDVIQAVLSKGWCGWKPPNFWKSEHFYNLLLPIPPSNVI